MPAVIDKIIINSERCAATHSAIMGEYKILTALGKEIQDGGWLGETMPMRDKMKLACDEHDAADLKYLASLRDVVQDLDDFINTKHQPKP